MIKIQNISNEVSEYFINHLAQYAQTWFHKMITITGSAGLIWQNKDWLPDWLNYSITVVFGFPFMSFFSGLAIILLCVERLTMIYFRYRRDKREQQKLDNEVKQVKYSKYKLMVEQCFTKWGIYKPERVELHCMLVAHESMLGKYRRQIGGGPARGLHQIEFETHDSIWDNSDTIKARAEKFGFTRDSKRGEIDDVYDLFVAAHYILMDENALPKTIEEMAKYAKSYWNRTGQATVGEYYNDYDTWVSQG